MGTRGLLGLIIAGQRYAAYNHWDSYPSGLGKEIFLFILSLKPEDWEKMATLVKEIEWVQESAKVPSELEEKYIKLGYFNAEVGHRQASSWYSLLREVQGSKALDEILKGDLKHLIQSVEFLEDGVFCEWAYFIDFEAKKFETWAHGMFLEETSLEELSEVDLDEYIEKLEALREDSYEKYAVQAQGLAKKVHDHCGGEDGKAGEADEHDKAAGDDKTGEEVDSEQKTER